MLFALAAGAHAADGPDRRAFLAHFNCAIATRLSVIRDTPAVKNRYLVLNLDGQPGTYVQCIFNDSGDMIFCEVASGYFTVAEGQPWTPAVSPAGLTELAQLGFDATVTNGNYPIERPVRSSADLEEMADLMLAALYEGFGARRHTPLVAKAPLANLSGFIPPSCSPAS